MSLDVAIASYGETPVSRCRKDKGELILTAEQYLSWAAKLTLDKVGLTIRDLDGQGLAISGPLVQVSELWTGEIAEVLGASPKILIRSDHAGASAPMLITQAAQQIRSGLVDMVLCLGGGARNWEEGMMFSPHQFGYEFERPFGMDGPNTKFGMVARRHFDLYGTKPENLGKLAVTQRLHASLNPNAYLKQPITMKDYLDSKIICDPLRILDCSIVVDGGAGFLIASAKKAKELTDNPVSLKGFGTAINYREKSDVSPDILITGVKPASRMAFEMSGLKPKDISIAHCYDDYSIMALIQLEDAGFCEKGKGGKFIEETDLSYNGSLPFNTSGGLLSAGQLPAAGSFTGVIEVVRQLKGEAGARQVKDARTGFMSSFGGGSYDLHLINTAAIVFGSES